MRETELTLLVVQRKSSFEIAIAKTNNEVAIKEQAFLEALVSGDPEAIVKTKSELKALQNGVELLNECFKILFPAN